MVDADTVTVGLGENVTCEVTNTDIAPELTLVKVLDIQHGGNASLDDFTLTATGPVTISGVTGDPDITNAPVDTGSYTLSETGPLVTPRLEIGTVSVAVSPAPTRSIWVLANKPHARSPTPTTLQDCSCTRR